MASLRQLRRRLLRWNRYAAKTIRDRQTFRGQAGHARAFGRFHIERGMRRWGVPESPIDQLCCLAGEGGHEGPCVISCDGCNGSGRCPECGGLDDLGCWWCDGTGGCPQHCDDGEIVLSDWAAR